MALAKLLLKLFFGRIIHFFHILVIQQRYLLYESGDDLPDISNSAVLLNLVECLEYVVQKGGRGDDIFGEEEFGDLLDIANEAVLVDLRDVASLLKDNKRLRDELRVKLESLLEQAIHNLFAVDVKDFF